MATLAKIQTRGQLTLPRLIREQAGVKAGDMVMVRVTPAGVVELRPLPSHTIDELAEMFPIEGPINESHDRDSWEADAAADVFGRQGMTADGLVDTNVFLHAHATDERSEECRRFLRSLQRGTLTARLDPLVLHELSYALRHYVKQMQREDIARYLLSVLSWPGITGDKDLLIDIVLRWFQMPGISFLDAHLGAVAQRDSRPVFTLNVRDLERQGVTVPQPLPHVEEFSSTQEECQRAQHTLLVTNDQACAT